MKTFYATAQAFYERDGTVRVIPTVLLIHALNEDHAATMAGDYLEDHFPAPGYFDHDHEVKELEGIAFTEKDVTLVVLSVVDEYILSTPPGGHK